jgi:hypothetical protein
MRGSFSGNSTVNQWETGRIKGAWECAIHRDKGKDADTDIRITEQRSAGMAPTAPQPQAPTAELHITEAYREPHWIVVFLLLTQVISLVPVVIGSLLGYTLESDMVMGIYAAFSGVAADSVLRRAFRRLLLLWHQPRIPFLAFWIGICAFIILIQPTGGQ